MNPHSNTILALLREATEEQAGIWSKLIAYCNGQGNRSYIIQDAATWSDRQWMTLAGIRNCPEEDSPLWQWRADTLVLIYEKQ